MGETNKGKKKSSSSSRSKSNGNTDQQQQQATSATPSHQLVSRRDKPSPPFGLSIDMLRHSSNQSVTLKRYLQLCRRIQAVKEQQHKVETDEEENSSSASDNEDDEFRGSSSSSSNKESGGDGLLSSEAEELQNYNLHAHLLNHVKHPNEMYEKCIKLTKKQYLSSLVSMMVKKPLFCPHQFRHFFYHYNYREYANARRSLRKIVMIETIQAFGRCKYYVLSEDGDAWARQYWQRLSSKSSFNRSDDVSIEQGEEEDNLEQEPDNEDQIDEDAEIEEEELDEDLTSEAFDTVDEEDSLNTIPEVSTVLLNWNNLVANVKHTTMIHDQTLNTTKLRNKGDNSQKKKKNRKGKRRQDEDSDEEEEAYVTEQASKPQDKRFAKTDIFVLDSDCLSAAIELKRRFRLNPAMLVMASQSHPGGGYRSGSGAQEEEISRRSQLYMCLDDPYLLAPERQWSYPLPEMGCVYVPKCTVIRDSERHGYAFLQKPIDISMIAMSTYSNPPLERARDHTNDLSESRNDDNDQSSDEEDDQAEWRFSGKIITKILQKIRVLFNTAIEKKHDSLVLSAWGSGVYSSPARHMAELFKQVLNEPAYQNTFRVVLFAIIDDTNAYANQANNNKSGNLLPFHEVFHGKTTSRDSIMNLEQFTAQWST